MYNNIIQNTNNKAAWLVYADYLMMANDPVGEAIAVYIKNGKVIDVPGITNPLFNVLTDEYGANIFSSKRIKLSIIINLAAYLNNVKKENWYLGTANGKFEIKNENRTKPKVYFIGIDPGVKNETFYTKTYLDENGNLTTKKIPYEEMLPEPIEKE